MTPNAAKRVFLWPALIAVAIGLVYLPAVNAPFVFDDGLTVIINPQVKQIFNPPGLGPDQMQTGLEGRPVLRLSFAINYAINGLDSGGYRAVNILIHLVSALLLMRLLFDLFTLRAIRTALELSGGIALLWAVHPINTEAVTYITQRSQSLMGMFFLLTMVALVRSRLSRRPAIWSWAGLISCALGMMCKEDMVVAPVVALLLDWLLLPAPADKRGRMIRRRLYVGLFLCWIILPVELQQANLESKAGYGLRFFSRWDNLKTQATVITHYLRLTFWPDQLEIDYFDWPVARRLLPVIAQCLLICSLLGATVYACFRRQWVALAGCWFFLVLAPTSSFIPMFTEIAAERRMYLASAPVICVVVLSLYYMLPLRWTWVTIIALALALGIRAWQRNQEYMTELRMWQRAVEVRPQNPRALTHLAQQYIEASPPQLALARAMLNRALLYQPRLVYTRQVNEELTAVEKQAIAATQHAPLESQPPR